MSEQLKASIARIFFSRQDTTVGIGFLVPDKHVLTCAHVVMQALGLRNTSSMPEANLRLDFPFVASGRSFNARLVCWQPGDGDDIAVLELETLPPATAHSVRLVDVQELWGHSFRAFGFPIEYDKGVWASGVLRQGQVGGWIQIEAINVPGHRVVQGFSGTPVWDEQLDGVVGMVVESDRQAQTKAAYIIPTALLVKAWPHLSQQTIPPCPFRGLFAFREVDEPYFFGRETYIAQLVETVQKKPFTAIIGSSGSGKSSVVFAGLVPQLSRSGNWIVASFRPGSQPFRALASALIPLLESEMSETNRLVEINKLARLLQKDELTLTEVMERIVHKHAGAHLLLVADQFEELYTLCSSEEERQHFLDLLLSINRHIPYRRLLNFHLVITLRADFCAHAFSYRPLADALQHADLKLGPMVRHELRDAIRKPAEKFKVRVDEELIERILGTVSKEPGHLPLLEFALTLLWKRQRASRLTLAAYDEIGGVEAALAAYADEIYESLSEEERVQAQQIFIQLVHPGEGTEDTRRIATRAEIGEKRWVLVPILSDARLVVSGRDESTGNDTVEVVHEALIRGWKRLCEWMEREREFRMWQERLRIAIRQWHASGKDDGAVLQGALLIEATHWLTQRSDTLSQQEQEFIEISQKHRTQLEEQRQTEKRTREALNALLAMTELLIQVPGNVEPASELMGRLAELTRKVLGCLQVAILSMDPKSMIIQPMAIAGLPYEAEDHWRTNTSGIRLSDYVTDPAGIALLSANEVWTLNVDQAGPHNHPSVSEKRGTRLVAPMCVADQLCGILSLEYQDENHNIRPEEVALVATVAKLISLVISYKQLLDEWAEAHANELALQEINKQVNQFMFTASHELRTPLVAMQGYLELLLNNDQNLSPQQRTEFLEKAHRDAEELYLMIANVMDASRVQVQAENTKLSGVLLQDTISHVLKVLEPMVQREHRTISVDVPDNLFVIADDPRLRQVLLNLISNAFKYSPTGTRVVITCYLDEQDVIVRVRDYGFGIEPEYQKRLFERFTRLEREINSPVRGAGLGLYISKQLVEAMGGSIWVESTGIPGEGSTFSFSLKRALSA